MMNIHATEEYFVTKDSPEENIGVDVEMESNKNYATTDSGC